MSGLGLALGARLLPVGVFFKRIPPKAWLGIGIALAALVGVLWHGHAVRKHYAEAYAAGVAHESARIEAKAKKLAADAAAISAKARSLNNETNRRIARDADALRVRGPGRAACLNPATPGASRRQPAIGQADAARPEVPPRDGEALLAAVPWPWLVDRAEQCDMNRAEAETWRNWHKQLVEAYEKADGSR
jgi:hypothetical protein